MNTLRKLKCIFALTMLLYPIFGYSQILTCKEKSNSQEFILKQSYVLQQVLTKEQRSKYFEAKGFSGQNTEPDPFNEIRKKHGLPPQQGQIFSGTETLKSDGLPMSWESHYASGLMSGYDKASDIAVDGSGNVYVTGQSTNSPFAQDYHTEKYDTAGNLIWSADYDGTGNGDDRAFAVKADISGNVYVTGYSLGSETGFDYATVKYDTNGNELWVARFNGYENYNDRPVDLTIDNSGNVYVTGWSVAANGYTDYATIKYNSSGEQQWIAEYDGTANSEDVGSNIICDVAGNVYVTGYSWSGTSYDYLTVKYNSAGEQQWATNYNGTGNHSDIPLALVVDGAGNSYVTGWITNADANIDCAVIKYNSEGVQQWVEIYDGPANDWDEGIGLALDNTGNVYVTGGSYGVGTSRDIMTIKYDTDGNQQWVARYDGPEYAVDKAYDIVIDNSGYIYITGFSTQTGRFRDYTTIKYDSDGEEQWIALYDGNEHSFDEAGAIAIDSSGNVCITGWSNGSGEAPDYATVKYNTSGTEQWVVRYDGYGNSEDKAKDIAVDHTGNVYTAGYSKSFETSYDFITVKNSTDGEELWNVRYNGPGNDEDQITALVADESGNVYVTGHSTGSGTGFDYATIKYNSDGEQQWVARYNGTGSAGDFAVGIALDGSGNIYVTGYSDGSGGVPDYATVKYNSGGEEQWVARFNGTENSDDEATAIAVDESGNVYVTGWSDKGFESTLWDFATIKYNSAGEQQWIAEYNGTGETFDYATALAVDESGNVYVTGWSDGTGSEADYATVKYDTGGTELWVSRYNGTGNNWDAPVAVAVDSSENVYVTGESYHSEANPYDFATVKYDINGNEEWVEIYNGPASNYDNASDLCVDNSGNVYVTGRSVGAGTSLDFATIKYNSEGTQQWLNRYNGPGSDMDEPSAITLDRAGNVYVTGCSEGYMWTVFSTIKYGDNPVTGIDDKIENPGNCLFLQNYPNPFSSFTTISYTLPENSMVTLRIINQSGREIQTLVNEEQSAGEYKIKFDARNLSGSIYFCCLETEKFSETQKLILIK